MAASSRRRARRSRPGNGPGKRNRSPGAHPGSRRPPGPCGSARPVRIARRTANAAVAQFDRPLAEGHGRRVVSGDDRRHAFDNPAELRHQPPRAGLVQAGRRLVQQPQPRAGPGQAPGHGQPAALPQAERCVEAAERRAQALRQGPQPRPELRRLPGPRSAARSSIPGRPSAMLSRTVAARTVGCCGTQPSAGPAARRQVRTLQASTGPPTGGTRPADHPEQARFAGAALADEAHSLPRGDPQVDPVQHRAAPARGRPGTRLRVPPRPARAGRPGARPVRPAAGAVRGGEAAQPRQYGPAAGTRVEIRHQPAQRQEHLGDKHQHRQGLRENPVARIEAQAERGPPPARCRRRPGARGPARRAARHAGSQAWPRARPRPRLPRPARDRGPGRRPAAAAGPRPARRTGRRAAAARPAGAGPRPRCPLPPGQPAPRPPPGSGSPGRPRPGPGALSRPAAAPAQPGPERSWEEPGPRRGQARPVRKPAGRHASGAGSRATPAGLVGRGQARRGQADARRQRPPPGRRPRLAGRPPRCRPPTPSRAIPGRGPARQPAGSLPPLLGGELPVQRGGEQPGEDVGLRDQEHRLAEPDDHRAGQPGPGHGDQPPDVAGRRPCWPGQGSGPDSPHVRRPGVRCDGADCAAGRVSRCRNTQKLQPW